MASSLDSLYISYVWLNSFIETDIIELNMVKLTIDELMN